MAGLKPVDDNNLSPALKTIVKRFRDDPDYVNGLKIFAHQPEFAEIAWSAYTQLLDRGKLPRELKELVRIKSPAITIARPLRSREMRTARCHHPRRPRLKSPRSTTMKSVNS